MSVQKYVPERVGLGISDEPIERKIDVRNYIKTSSARDETYTRFWESVFEHVSRTLSNHLKCSDSPAFK